MFDGDEISLLVSNILHGEHLSHCRLCLKELKKYYVKLDDILTNAGCSENEFQTLSNILSSILNTQIHPDIPGMEAVCTSCAEKAVEAFKFLTMCNKSITLLVSIFTKLHKSLDIDINSLKGQIVYLIVNKQEVKVLSLPSEEKYSNRTKILNVKGEHACPACNKVFEDNGELQHHHITHHHRTILTCEICYEMFINESDLNSHATTTHFKCTECNIFMKTASALKTHEDKLHNIHICSECGKTYKGLEKLNIHRLKHSCKNKCPKCKKSYNTKDYFQKHVKLCLTGQLDPHPSRNEIKKPFVCSICGKGYSTPGGLRVHDRFEHGGANPHVCEQCGKKFTAPSYLKIHMIKHTGEKNFKCECGNRFVSKEALLYHKRRRHTGERPYSCKLCNEKFVNASARAEHIKFKHIGPTLQCDICAKKFVTTNFLKKHISRHYNPASKLYSNRCLIPPNVPGEHNMRIKIES